MELIKLPSGRFVNLAAYRQFEVNDSEKQGTTITGHLATTPSYDSFSGRDAEFLLVQLDARDQALYPYGGTAR